MSVRFISKGLQYFKEARKGGRASISNKISIKTNKLRENNFL